MRIALTYRVLQHWRLPVFARLARTPGVVFRAFHGSDFTGTKVLNGHVRGEFDHVELPTLPIKLQFGGEPILMPVTPTLPLELAKFKPDVILTEGASNFLNNIGVFAYAKATRTPVVWWTLGELNRPKSRARKLARSIKYGMEAQATVWLGYSSRAVQYFDSRGYPEERRFRAVNCIDTELEETNLERDRLHASVLRKELGLEGKRIVLFVGALTLGKRLDVLVDAFAPLSRSRGDVVLVIVGDGVARGANEALVRAHGISESVRFVGSVVDGVGAYFELGDLFVLPGLGGLAVSQAMVHSLPIIATEADGCEVDLVRHGKNGFILPTGDTSALETAIASLLDSDTRLQAFGRESRRIVSEEHNIASYMENVLAALRCAVARGGSSEIPRS